MTIKGLNVNILSAKVQLDSVWHDLQTFQSWFPRLKCNDMKLSSSIYDHSNKCFDEFCFSFTSKINNLTIITLIE